MRKLIYSRLTSVAVLMACLIQVSVNQRVKIDPVVKFCQSPGMFAMTFDQGPSIYTGTVLDALASRQVKATFHPVVSYLSEVTVVANLKRAAGEGHTIGLSMEASVDLSKMSDDDIFNTIDSRAQTIQSITGLTPKFLRIPNYQNLSDAQIAFILSKGYIITTYNLDSYDYDQTDVLSSFKNVLELLSPNTKGAFISVQRDYIQNSVNQLPQILDYVMGKGYNLVTMDQCVKNAGGSSSSGSSSGGSSSGGSAPVSSGAPASSGSGGSQSVQVSNQNGASRSYETSHLIVVLSLLCSVLLFAF